MSFGGSARNVLADKGSPALVGAARRDWYIKRSDHVLTFEQQKSTLAWCKQTLSACMLSQGTVTCMALVAFLLLFGSVILLAFARRRAAAETGLARTYKAYR